MSVHNRTQADKSRQFKFVVVGDGGVGKTSMLITYAIGKFPTEYFPTRFDENVTVMADGEPCTVYLNDTAGGEDYARLRPLEYVHADVFLVCFSVVGPASFRKIRTEWVPEITHHSPWTPFLLVGTKTDLRDDAPTNAELAKEGCQPTSTEQGENLAEEMKAVKYVECSALTQKGLKNVFDVAIRLSLEVKKHVYKNKRKCIIL